MIYSSKWRRFSKYLPKDYELLKVKRLTRLTRLGVQINEETLKQMYIHLLDDISPTLFGDYLLSCMQYYGAYNLSQLTTAQLKNYWEMIINESERQEVVKKSSAK